jgi:hypothetical protein
MTLASTATACAGAAACPPGAGGADAEAARQAAILAAELAALGAGEPPPVAELWGLAPDPDSDPPDGPEAAVPAEVLIAAAAADRAAAAAQAAGLLELFPPGMRRGADGPGGGFEGGGVLDVAEPGVALAGFAAGAQAAGLGALGDDELIGVVRAWRRLSSWAAAGEFAAVGELVARREADRTVRGYGDPLASVPDELACALTLTCRAADGLVDRAVALRGLPVTAAALARGAIDVPKALVVIDGVAGLDPVLARAVEDRVVPAAAGRTAGELRAAVRRAVLAADPKAAQRRREKAQKDARVEVWDEPAGTKALAGRDLPPAGVLAADRRIAAIARTLKKAGAPASMDVLRARVYLALLAGQPLEDLLPADPPGEQPGPAPDPDQDPALHGGGDQDGDLVRPQHQENPHHQGDPPESGNPQDPGGPGDANSHQDRTNSQEQGSSQERGGPQAGRNPRGQQVPRGGTGGRSGGAGWPGLLGTVAGSVNLTVPLRTLLGLGESPGQVAGFGPLDAGAARVIAAAAARHPATRWCVTVTDDAGHAIGHGCGPNRAAGSRGTSRAGEASRAGAASEAGARAAGEAGRRGEAGEARPVGGTGAADGWNLVIKVEPLASGDCSHDGQSAGYQPSPRLRHLIEIRDQTCSFPGCRRPAVQCDKDHTMPYDQGGRTCQCNIAPLCRRHHQVKQAARWRLEQPRPGVLEWVTPSGRRYLVGPDPNPV